MATWRQVLRLPRFRLLLSAFAVSQTGDWAYNVALWALIYQRTGSAAWVAAASTVKLAPYVLFSAIGGVLADRYPRVALMVGCDVARALLMAGLAVAAALQAPVLLLIGLPFAVTTFTAPYGPATAAMTPELVSESSLAAANAAISAVEMASIVIGPVIGAVLLALGNPTVSFAVDAATFVVSAGLVGRLRSPARVAAEQRPGAWTALRGGVAALVDNPLALLLICLGAAASGLYGADTVLFTVLSRHWLGTGGAGIGYLLAGLGVGGLLGAPVVPRLAARRRIVWILVAALCVYSLPTALLAVVHSAPVAVALQVVRGGGTVVVDVLAVTAMQRLLDRTVLGRVFGLYFTINVAAMVVGAIVVAPVVSALGIARALLVVGGIVPLAALVLLPRLAGVERASERAAAAVAPTVQLLAGLPLFAAAARSALEWLAASAEPVTTAAGTAVVVQGDPAEAFYVVLSGALEVTAGGVALGRLAGGDYFGEIGLLAHGRRTATVTATEDCRLLRIDAASFDAALARVDGFGPAMTEGAAARLARGTGIQPRRADRDPLRAGT